MNTFFFLLQTSPGKQQTFQQKKTKKKLDFFLTIFFPSSNKQNLAKSSKAISSQVPNVVKLISR